MRKHLGYTAKAVLLLSAIGGIAAATLAAAAAPTRPRARAVDNVTFVALAGDQAQALKSMLGVEDTLAADAVRLEPNDRAIAQKLETRNRTLIKICEQIITDAATARDVESLVHHSSGGHAGDSASVNALSTILADATASIKAKLASISRMAKTVSMADLFEMQMLMNHLSQLSDMSANLVSATNSAIASMARNVKG
jgi:hypothetical protein